MKLKITNLKAFLVSGLMLLGYVVGAQTAYYPFPQNKSYLGGVKPTNVTATAMSTAALASYNTWKTNFVTSTGACGYRRVKFDYYSGGLGKTDGSTTVSEGIGYGMLLSAYAADATLFADLWNYYKKNVNGNGVMNWKVENCGAVGANGASDAELDVAMALIVASYQWQSDAYLQDAKKMIAIIRTKEFEGSILKPGDQFGGSSLVNPSYFSPAYYRIFATLDAGQSTFWNNAVTKGYEIINLADKNKNGFVPDWCDANGNTGVGGASQYKDGGKFFFFDAIRTPWRSAIDVLWHGSTTAAAGAAYVTRLTDFIFTKYGGTTVGTGSYYDLSGNVKENYHNNTFVSCFGMAGMAANGTKNYQSFVNNAWTDNANTNPGYGEYFNYSFKVLGQFTMSGNFYNPTATCTGANLGASVGLCKASTVTLNSGITGATSYTWSLNGATIAGATGATYTTAANTPGNYQVVVNQSGCVTRSNVLVDQAAITADFTYSVQGINVVLTNTSAGASNYTWEYSTTAAPTTWVVIGTTRDIATQFATAGNYNIRLTTKNTTYGCTGTATTTKKVAVGNGAGWVIDDFNDHTVGDAFVGSNMTALPKTYCSAEDELLNNGKNCSNNPCGLLQAIVTTSNQYSPFGVSINDSTIAATDPTAKAKKNLDISTVPYVAVRLRADKAINIGIGVNGSVLAGCPTCTTEKDWDGSVKTTATTNRKFFNIAANRDTVLYLDFSLAADKLGYYSPTKSSTPIDFTKVNGIEFYPQEKTSTWTGTVTVDWIIVGGKSLKAPVFNLKRDTKGYLVYEDPDGDEIYTTVPDWKRKVTACTGTATITANACTATKIEWYKNGALIASGATAQGLTPGKYIVNLINAGGVTKDSVEVVGAALTADFEINRVNYGAHFENTSPAGFTGFSWAYGDVANDLAGSTKWDKGYHNYKTAGAGTYTVSLTLTDSICKTSKTLTKQLVVACDSLVKKPVIVSFDSSAACEGDIRALTILPIKNAEGPYGWFGPAGTTIVNKTVGDTLTKNFTFGAVGGPITIEGYNDCGKATTTVKLVPVTAKPSSAFTFTQLANTASFDATYTSVPAATYAWTFGDANASTSALKAPSFLYPNVDKTYDVSLTVSNTCGTSTKTTKSVTILKTSLDDLATVAGIKIYPTVTSSNLNVELTGSATFAVVNVIGHVSSTSTISGSGSIDVSSLPSGVYFLNIVKDGKAYVTRFVKQ